MSEFTFLFRGRGDTAGSPEQNQKHLEKWVAWFKELGEKVETYGKPFTLVQDVTVLSTAAAKKALAAPVKLTGKLEYQACDDKVCYAPAKIPVSFDLTVK